MKTLAGALFARSFSLASLSDFLQIEHPKFEFDDFDAPISDEMIRYAVRDPQTTWECYKAAMCRFEQLGLAQAKPEKIYSEAGIGKSYLKEMGIQPWRKIQPNCPRDVLAKIMGSYFGGRSEVRIRREIRQIILCDFLSMYPTVCTVMGLWRFVIAEGMSWHDVTDETREFLANVDLVALQAQETWRGLTTLVRVLPEGDIFPVRAGYQGEGQKTIGANFLTSDTPLWFTLADCIATKLLTGRAPHIIEAIAFAPGPVQRGLAPINISGNTEYRVDPNEADFFKLVIELRQSIKRQMKNAVGDERARLDIEQNALKICANSTSYGIWVEINVDARPKPVSTTVHSSTCLPFSFRTDKQENPGSYFHPLLASLITGAARLMLAITERLVSDQGLDWSFCDTDSMAIAKPDGMASADFADRTQTVVDWFATLNPYEFGGSILQIESVNQSLSSGEPEPLFCWAISSKRYALYNLDSQGSPIMRKVSAHGLGHLRAPYNEVEAPAKFPKPDKSVLKDGTERWHCDLWHQIVSAALAGHPDQVARNYHGALSKPAVSRYAATSPDLLRWFKSYNAARLYRDQVKPFGFLLSLTAAREVDIEGTVATIKRGRPKKDLAIKPIAPFDSDHVKAVTSAFDRETGSAVIPSSLQSYADALARYHISPESKFLNADYLNRGTTTRRHIFMSNVLHIGKEAHDWERQAIMGISADSEVAYGVATDDLAEKLRNFVGTFGESQAAKSLNVSKIRLAVLLSGSTFAGSIKVAEAIATRLPSALQLCAKLHDKRLMEIIELKHAILRDGLRETARKREIDPSNLRRSMIR